MVSGAKSYMRKGFLIHCIWGNALIFSPYMRTSLFIYNFAPDIWGKFHFLFYQCIVGRSVRYIINSFHLHRDYFQSVSQNLVRSISRRQSFFSLLFYKRELAESTRTAFFCRSSKCDNSVKCALQIGEIGAQVL